MSEPVGAKHSRRKWGKIFLEILGAIAAVATTLALVFYLQERFEVLEEEEYKKLVNLKEQYERGELITEADCPKQPEVPPPPIPPEMDQATMLTDAIDQLIQEAGFLTKYEGSDFFERFDRWRSNAKNKLADGQKLISDWGWTSNKDWVETFHAQTHINRNLGREPYRPEEYRRFLESGAQVLERMKREVAVHSGKETPPTGSLSPPEG